MVCDKCEKKLASGVVSFMLGLASSLGLKTCAIPWFCTRPWSKQQVADVPALHVPYLNEKNNLRCTIFCKASLYLQLSHSLNLSWKVHACRLAQTNGKTVSKLESLV